MSEHDTLREANIARQREWDKDDKITLSYRGNELAGEVGEVCNIIKKLERERLGIRGSRATLAQLAEELAYVVICTDLVAMAAGIDLEAAVVAKFNATSAVVGLSTRLRLRESVRPDEVSLRTKLPVTVAAPSVALGAAESPTRTVQQAQPRAQHDKETT